MGMVTGQPDTVRPQRRRVLVVQRLHQLRLGVVAGPPAEDTNRGAVWFSVRPRSTSPAQDVVQETMLRAWRNPKILSQPPGQLRAWLFTVARHIVIDDWRAHQVRPEPPTAEPPEPGVEDNEVDAMLQSWVVADAVGTSSAELAAARRDGHDFLGCGEGASPVSRGLRVRDD